MARLGHLKQSTTLFPQRLGKNHQTLCTFGPASRKKQSVGKLGKPVKTGSKCHVKRKGGHADISDFEFSASNSFISYKEYKETVSSVKCYLCCRAVKVDHLSEHLLFGEVKCAKCNIIFTDCQHFQLWTVEKNMGSVLCEHALMYLGDPIEKLKTFISKDGYSNDSVFTALELKSLLKKYIIGIKSLKNSLPWQKVIAQFMECDRLHHHRENIGKSERNKDEQGNKLKLQFHSNITNSEFSDSVDNLSNSSMDTSSKVLKLENVERKFGAPTSDKHSKDNLKGFSKSEDFSHSRISHTSFKGSTEKQITLGSDCKRKKLSDSVDKRRANTPKPRKSSDYVETPSSGFYYVVRHSITECPNCYTKLNPVDYSVNIVTFLMTGICSGCSLTIYVVHDPPDDGAPRVCIITDQKAGKRKCVKSTHTKRIKPKSLPEQ